MTELSIPIQQKEGHAPVAVKATLVVPDAAKAIVVFAHGSGSGRFSPRNRYVAGVLQQHQLATLLLDLLTSEEDEVDRTTAEYRFQIPLLADRLQQVAEWLKLHQQVSTLPIAFFGASTGAAAALVAAARMGRRISSVVSRGGRPDLAADLLPLVKAPTLLLVGGWDTQVITLNELAYDQLICPKELHIVPGATHLFEEPGTLEQAAELAAAWFVKYSAKQA